MYTQTDRGGLWTLCFDAVITLLVPNQFTDKGGWIMECNFFLFESYFILGFFGGGGMWVHEWRPEG